MVFRMRAYTHRGWAHRQRVRTNFLTRKNSKLFSVVLLTGFEPSTFGSPVQRSNHWANPSPCGVMSGQDWSIVMIISNEHFDATSVIYTEGLSTYKHRAGTGYKMCFTDTTMFNNQLTKTTTCTQQSIKKPITSVITYHQNQSWPVITTYMSPQHTHPDTDTHTHTLRHTLTLTHTHTGMHTHKYTGSYTHTHWDTHTGIHTHTYWHTYTHTKHR